MSLIIPTMYIETSPFNFIYSKESNKQQATQKLFDRIAKGVYKGYTSDIVLNELNNAEPDKRDKMVAMVTQYGIEKLYANDEAKSLAKVYVKKGIIPEKYYMDALHIAIASVNRLNFVVSFNYGHIVKLKTLNMTGLVNVRRGYPQVGLITPLEVEDDDEN
jgi:uncharacterized radical SAM superfamily Fe-S cluster-containing enzyme